MTCGHCEKFGVPPNVQAVHMAAQYFTRAAYFTNPRGIYFFFAKERPKVAKIGAKTTKSSAPVQFGKLEFIG